MIAVRHASPTRSRIPKVCPSRVARRCDDKSRVVMTVYVPNLRTVERLPAVTGETANSSDAEIGLRPSPPCARDLKRVLSSEFSTENQRVHFISAFIRVHGF